MEATGKSVPPLVNARWLADRLEDRNTRIIDARPTVLYLMEHIKNAVSASYSKREYVSFGTDISKGGGVELFSDPSSPIPFQDGPPEMVKEVLGKRLGISPETLVVIYSDGSDGLDARFWWTLERLGHNKMCLLNGGLDKWLELGYKTVKKVNKAEPVEYRINGVDNNGLVDTRWVLEHMADPDVKLVFALPQGMYFGQQVLYPREGHIPGSVCVPLARHFNDDSTWKSAAELRRMYHNFGVTEDKTVVSYCLHAVPAAGNYFALRHLLGYPRVKLYLASLADWCRDPRGLPLDTYGNPQLLKEPSWVYYWGEKAKPLMNDPRVRVVDVRTAAEYNGGHIPYALSLPLEDVYIGDEVLLRTNKLRALLGRIGVSADTRVVIYDGGDAHRAAWLFWLLEYLGHKDVSILNGGFARWKATGHVLSTKPPVIRRSKSDYRFDLSIRPARFIATAQPGKFASSDWTSKHTNNPDKVFLDAGNSSCVVGTVTSEGLNIPWSANINGDGTFKNAAQLAKIYDEAGIDLFKEVVCYSESPLDAAHTYFTLRLLGYPRVRLCPKI